MSITPADKDSILKRLYDDDPDVWAFAQADAIELIEKQGDELTKLNTQMPCGHLARYQALDAIERPYCVKCKAENLQHENDFLNGLIAGTQTEEAQS